VESELFLLRKNRRKDKALAELAVAVERSDVCKEDILELLDQFCRRYFVAQPLVVSIGLNLHELFEEDVLPELGLEFRF
jgi:hypothetical protein